MSGEFHQAVEEVVLTENTPFSIDYQVHSEADSKTLQALHCEICSVKVTSQKIMQRHLEGRRHRMKVERSGKVFTCELCDIVANSEIQLNIHLSSSKHKNRVARQEKGDYVPNKVGSSGPWIIIFCVFCVFVNLFFLFKVFCD